MEPTSSLWQPEATPAAGRLGEGGGCGLGRATDENGSPLHEDIRACLCTQTLSRTRVMSLIGNQHSHLCQYNLFIVKCIYVHAQAVMLNRSAR